MSADMPEMGIPREHDLWGTRVQYLIEAAGAYEQRDWKANRAALSMLDRLDIEAARPAEEERANTPAARVEQAGAHWTVVWPNGESTGWWTEERFAREHIKRMGPDYNAQDAYDAPPVSSPVSPEERAACGCGFDGVCFTCRPCQNHGVPQGVLDPLPVVAGHAIERDPESSIANCSCGFRAIASGHYSRDRWVREHLVEVLAEAPAPPPVGEWTDEEVTSEIAEATASEVQAGQEVLYEVDGLAPRWMPVAKIAQSDSPCWDLVFHWEETGSMPVRLSSTVVVRRPALRPNRPEVGEGHDDEWMEFGSTIKVGTDGDGDRTISWDDEIEGGPFSLSAEGVARLVAALGGGGGKPELTDEMTERACSAMTSTIGNLWARTTAVLRATGAFSTPSGEGEGR